MLSDFMLRVRALFKRAAVERDMDDELRFHADRQFDRYVREGMDPAEAARRLRHEFGGLDQVKEEYRDALGVRIIDNLWRDARLAVRSLRAAPMVSAVAILSLALGIGANTAMFSIVNSLVLRDLPVWQPDRLAVLMQDGHETSWTNPIWENIRSRNDVFPDSVAWAPERFDLSQGGEADMVDGVWTSGRFFDVLGVQALVGRTWTSQDDRRGGGPDGTVAVISHEFWLRRFEGAPDAIGRRITLNRVPFTIIGVTPPGFSGPEVGRTADVMIPIGTEPLLRGSDSYFDGRQTWWLNIMVRLAPGQSLAAAQGELARIQPAIRTATLPPDLRPGGTYLDKPLTLASGATGISYLRTRYQRPLLTMLIVVGLVLLIACANIANLLLARATARRHELSIRLALGASGARLVQQFLTESLILAGIGASVGFAFAHWAARVIVSLLSTQTNLVVLDLATDWRVLGFTTALTVITALVFGTIPALRASRVPVMASMKDGGRTSTVDRRHGIASGLVVAQVALSLILIVVAGLFLRTFVSLTTLPIGVTPERVLVVNMTAPQAQFRGTDLRALYERVRTAVAAVPDIDCAALSRYSPVTGGPVTNTRVDVDGGPTLTDGQRATMLNRITPQWFTAVGTRLLAGRTFVEGDRADAPLVAIVNEAFARQFGLGGNPVGRVILRKAPTGPQFTRIEIVGLVENAVYRLPRDPMPATMYLPIAQSGDAPSSIALMVRAAVGDPSQLTKSVAAAVAGVNHDLVLTFRPLREQVDATLVQERLLALLSGFFGGLALLLAGLGLYGTMSYAVSRRRTEIGIRMALGSAPGRVIRLVLARGLILVSLGVVAGGIASMWASRFVGSLLFGVEPRDPATFFSAVAILVTVAMLAAWLPARRAATIDPAAVLRES